MFTFKFDSSQGTYRANFPAKLISVSSDVRELNNENRTKYRVSTIEFVNKDGVVKQATALIYEANYAYGMTEGNTYLASATFTQEAMATKGAPLLTVSHLAAAERASADDFGFDFENPVQTPLFNVVSEDDLQTF